MIWRIKTYINAYIKKKWIYTIQYVKPTAQLVLKIDYIEIIKNHHWLKEIILINQA